MNLWQTVESSFIGNGIKVASLQSLRIFSTTLVYYISLYFSTSNRTLLLLTFLYWLAVLLITRNFILSLFLGLTATLLFPKGQVYQLLLLPKEVLERWAWFDISYIFPVYLADIFLVLLIYLYLRSKLRLPKGQSFKNKRNIFNLAFISGLRSQSLLSNAIKKKQILNKVKMFPGPLWWFFLFIFWVILSGSLSIIPEISWLSVIQLLRMAVLFGLPLLMGFKINEVKPLIVQVSMALIFFESFWAAGQQARGGFLGKDIEAYLPGLQYGIVAFENGDLLRSNGTFFEPSILGTFLLMHMAILIPSVLIRKLKNGEQYLVATLGLIFGSMALIFTGSRILYGVWVFVFILLWPYLKSYLNKLKKDFLSVSPLIMTGFMIIIGLVLFPYLMKRVQTLTEVFGQHGSATYRLEMMSYSFRLALGRPLLGVGINLSPYYYATGFKGERFLFDPTYPHNLLFQLLAETGVVGLSLFSLFIYLIFQQFFKNLRLGKINEYTLSAGVYLLSAMFYPIFLNHSELSSYFFLYAGLGFLKAKNISSNG